MYLEAEFSVEIEYEDGKYFFSEKAYRKIIWFSNLFALLSISLFLESFLIRKYVSWGFFALVLGMIVFIIPILISKPIVSFFFYVKGGIHLACYLVH